MTLFNCSDKAIITGGTFTQIVQSTPSTRARTRLSESIAAGARHDSAEQYDAPTCHPHTRVAVLEYIISWAGTPLRSGEPRVKWLNGAAGAGKSSIMQTVAVECAKRGTLGASFFFKHLHPQRGISEHLIITLIYQLWEAIPEARAHIDAAVDLDPAFFTRSLQSQLNILLVQPLLALEYPLRRPLLIVIDGLDECDNHKHQIYIIQLLLDTCRDHPSLPFRFLVASRAEYHLKSVFSSPASKPLTTEITLHNNTSLTTTSDDIKLYLNSKFEYIRNKRNIPPGWPTADQLQRITYLSSFSFIFASTAISHVDSDYHRPQNRLHDILGTSSGAISMHNNSGNPLGALDALYSHIISSVPHQHLTRALIVLGIYSHGGILQAWIDSKLEHAKVFQRDLAPSPKEIESILGFEDGDVELCLRPLASVVHVKNADSMVSESPGNDQHESPITILHASLRDFFVVEERAGRFYLPLGKVWLDHVQILFRLVLEPFRFVGLKRRGTPTPNDFISDNSNRRIAILYSLIYDPCQVPPYMVDEPFPIPDSDFGLYLSQLNFAAIFDQTSSHSRRYRLDCLNLLVAFLGLYCDESMMSYQAELSGVLGSLRGYIHRLILTGNAQATDLEPLLPDIDAPDREPSLSESYRFDDPLWFSLFLSDFDYQTVRFDPLRDVVAQIMRSTANGNRDDNEGLEMGHSTRNRASTSASNSTTEDVTSKRGMQVIVSSDQKCESKAYPTAPQDPGTVAPSNKPAKGHKKPTKGKKKRRRPPMEKPNKGSGSELAKNAAGSDHSKISGEDIFGEFYQLIHSKTTRKKIAELYAALPVEKQMEFEKKAEAAASK